MKIKRLPPSLRARKRYIAFRVEGDDPLRRDEVVRAIWREAMGFLGARYMSEVDLWVMDFNAEAQQGFLACRHEAVGEVKACLALISMIDGRRVRLFPLGVSGTIEALERKFLKEEPFVKQEGEVAFMGGLKLARGRGECLDALPLERGLEERVKDLNLKYIGLIKDSSHKGQEE